MRLCCTPRCSRVLPLARDAASPFRWASLHTLVIEGNLLTSVVLYSYMEPVGDCINQASLDMQAPSMLEGCMFGLPLCARSDVPLEPARFRVDGVMEVSVETLHPSAAHKPMHAGEAWAVASGATHSGGFESWVVLLMM